MKAINCIFRETIKEGTFEMKSHILIFLDDNGTERSGAHLSPRYDTMGILIVTNMKA